MPIYYRIIQDGKLTAPVWYLCCARPSRYGSVLVERADALEDSVRMPGSRIVSHVEIFGPATTIQAAVLQQLADALGLPYDGYNCLEIQLAGVHFNLIITCHEDYIRNARSLDYIVSFADPEYVQVFLARLRLLHIEIEQSSHDVMW